MLIFLLLIRATFIGSTILAGKYIMDKGPRFVIFLSLAIVMGVLEFYFLKQKILITKRKVYGCLETAYSIAGFSKEQDIRITLYIPSMFNSKKLKQATRYYPSLKYGSLKAGIKQSKGIVGKCYRSNKEEISEVKPRQKPKKYLMEHWGFTEDEVMNMQLDRKSYLVSPVRDKGGNVKGIVYLDSVERNVFSSEIAKIIAKACIPIATLI